MSIMKPKHKNMDMERHLAILGHDFFALLAGRSELVNGRIWRVPESSPHKKWEWMEKERLQGRIELYQRLGWTVWISLNDLEPGHMTVESVRRMAVIWFDIDAPRTDKSRPADEEERLTAKFEAERLKRYVEKKYGAQCFLACSGNGWHLYCPVPAVELHTPEDSWNFNNRLKAWMKQVRNSSSVDFDHTYNVNRLVQPIGFPNLKIPHHPLPTYWYDKFNIEDVEIARNKNSVLLNSILSVKEEDSKHLKKGKESQLSKTHPNLEEIIHYDKWFRDLYIGYWVQYGYKSRSEAELALVRELVHWGFSDLEIYEIMKNCCIGKWQTAGESYRCNTIYKARLWEARKKR